MNSFRNHQTIDQSKARKRPSNRSLGHRFRWLLGHVEPIVPLVTVRLTDDESQSDSETDCATRTTATMETDLSATDDFVQRERKSISCVIEANTPTPKPAPRKIEHRVETLRPVVSMVFVLPLVLFYEIGMIVFHSDAQRMRVGIDHWVQQFLELFGAGKLVVLPLLTLAILLFWHHRIHDRWQFKLSTIGGLIAEAIGLGVIMAVAANLTGLMAFGQTPPVAVGLVELIRDPVWCSQAISCVGAGIYEELIFRVLIFLPLAAWLARKLNDETVALVASMLVVSALFSIVHYDVVNPTGEPFQAATFLFRFAGSMIFCLLFKFRGLAIAVGAHVVFDVMMLS